MIAFKAIIALSLYTRPHVSCEISGYRYQNQFRARVEKLTGGTPSTDFGEWKGRGRKGRGGRFKSEERELGGPGKFFNPSPISQSIDTGIAGEVGVRKFSSI